MGEVHYIERPNIESQKDLLIGRIIENKYKLESLISKGGMGSVYSARRNRIGDFVAVKVLKIGEVFDQVTLKRFQLEAAASASIKHQNVISIYDFGLLDDIAYLVMEKLEGPPLSSELAAYGTCSPERSIRIFKQIAAAVAAAHKQGIIHRDLKPSNIIFQHAGCVDDQLKVVDFGLAKLIRVQNPNDKITVENVTVGTPTYMSPEQCLGHTLDERSDVYALGVLLFEMLTGDAPFTDFTASKIMIKHVTQAPPSMRSFIPDIPEEVDAVVLKALEKIPEKRYRSAIEMATEFELAFRNTTISKQRELRSQNGASSLHSLNVTLSEMAALMNDVAASSRLTTQVPQFETRIPAPLKFSFERFVGRSSEIAQIKEQFEIAKSRESRSVFVIGDPGVGKTELICQFRKQLKPSESFFLSGKFYEYGSDGPYRPYLDGIYNFTRSLKKYSPEGWAQPDATGLIDAVERGLDEIERLIGSPKKGSSEEQIKYLVFEKLTKIFTTISSSSPLIIFLDDVQWADSNNLEYLAYLIQNTEKDRILTLCTARAQDASDAAKPIKSWLSRLSRRVGCDQIRLGPLSEIEIRKLIDSIFGVIKISEAVVGRFYETTQGNPFYLGEIVRQLIQEQRIDWNGERWVCADIEDIEIPNSILELVELRLKRLSDETLDAFTRAAVVGEKFSFQLLRAVTEMPQDALMEIIDTGLSEFIIKEPAVSFSDSKEMERFSDDVFIFCHSTLRKALYERLSNFRRCRLHAQIGNRLENLSLRKLERNAGELAYHFYYGSNHRKALYYSAAAGETARRVFAMEEAMKYFSWAEESFNQMLEVEEDHGCEPEWIGNFRLSYGSVLTHLGKNEDARRQLDAALDLSRKHGLAKLEGGTLQALGELSWSCGDYKEAIEFSESALKFAREFEDATRECRILGLIASR